MTRSKNEGVFGFRDLQGFNSAILATMAALLMDEPNSLWAQVIKGIYFPRAGFLHAVKGGKPRGVGLVCCMVEISSSSMVYGL